MGFRLMYNEALLALSRGEAIVFPTDTIVGLGISVRDAASPKILYQLKHRSPDKPIAWLVTSADDLMRYGRNVPDYAKALAHAFWPGVLTLVVPASDAVPPAFQSAAGTIALRCPNHPVALNLLTLHGAPLATTSANLSGQEPVSRISDLDPSLAEHVCAIVSGAALASGVASTIVDCTGSEPVILREGSLTRTVLEEVIMSNQETSTAQTTSTCEIQAEADELGMELVAPGVGRFTGSMPSHDGISTLRTLTWVPLVEPIRGIVQVVHGMVEHIGRYETLAIPLAQAGFLVFGEDHIGHGLSASDQDRGHLPFHHGDDIMVMDAHKLGSLYHAAYPEVPFFLFGHSMGSFISRRLAADFGGEYDGVIVCGTGNLPVAKSQAANLLARVLCKTKGERMRSSFVDSLGVGAYNKMVENPTSPLSWLAVNEEDIRDYEADPLCGAMFTVGGYGSLTRLTAEVASADHARCVPPMLPMFFIAGAQDPVGECGKGVLSAVELYRGAGVLDVTMRLYPGMRHEILNEVEADQVKADILTWIQEHMD